MTKKKSAYNQWSEAIQKLMSEEVEYREPKERTKKGHYRLIKEVEGPGPEDFSMTFAEYKND